MNLNGLIRGKKDSDDEEQEALEKKIRERFADDHPRCVKGEFMVRFESPNEVSAKCEICSKTIDDPKNVWQCECAETECKPYCDGCVTKLVEVIVKEKAEAAKKDAEN